MILKIKLEDKKLCNGCPALNSCAESGYTCNMNFWTEYAEITIKHKCEHCKEWVSIENENKGDCTKSPKGWEGKHYFDWNIEQFYRPAKCIQENGD